MKLRWLGLVVFCACAPASWQVRTLPACYERLEDRAQERERAELAAVIALQNRGYAVSRRDGWIEGVSAGPRWRVRVSDAAELDVDAPSGGETAVNRKYFGELQQSVAQVRCRPLEELRAEAQDRTSGGDDVQARLIALHAQRDQKRLAGPITVTAIGGGIAVVGLALITDALIWRADGCDVDEYGYNDCSLRDIAKPVGITGAVMVGVGAAVVGVSLPWMFRTIKQRSALNREIRTLSTGQLSLGPTSVNYRLTF